MRAAARSVTVSRCVRGIDSSRTAQHQSRSAPHRADGRRARGGRFCLVDGSGVPEFGFDQRAVIDGDCRSAAIAAASVLAKVSRDRYMRRAAERHPGWDFEYERRLLDARAPGGHNGQRRAVAPPQCCSSRSPTRSWPSRADRRAGRASGSQALKTRPRGAPARAAARRGRSRCPRRRSGSRRRRFRCSPARPAIREPWRAHGGASRGRSPRTALSGPGSPWHHPGLDLAEHEEAPRVAGHQVELAVTGPEVAGEKTKPSASRRRAASASPSRPSRWRGSGSPLTTPPAPSSPRSRRTSRPSVSSRPSAALTMEIDWPVSRARASTEESRSTASRTARSRGSSGRGPVQGLRAAPRR